MEPAMTDRIARVLVAAGVPFTIHQHVAAHTVAEARATLPFPVANFLKTVVLRLADGPLVLAALCGDARLDYRLAATALGVRRGDLRVLSAEEVAGLLGVAPGGVGPLLPGVAARVLIDPAGAALTTAYCGAGHPERTLEIGAADLVRVSGAVIAPLAR